MWHIQDYWNVHERRFISVLIRISVYAQFIWWMTFCILYYFCCIDLAFTHNIEAGNEICIAEGSYWYEKPVGFCILARVLEQLKRKHRQMVRLMVWAEFVQQLVVYSKGIMPVEVCSLCNYKRNFPKYIRILLTGPRWAILRLFIIAEIIEWSCTYIYSAPRDNRTTTVL